MLSVSEQRDIHGHAAALSNAKVNKPTHNICTDITVAPKWSESTHTTMTLLRLFTLRFSHFFPPHPMEMCACWLWALCHLLSNREHFRIFHKHNMNWSDGSVRSAKKQIICNIFIRNSHICNEYQWQQYIYCYCVLCCGIDRFQYRIQMHISAYFPSCNFIWVLAAAKKKNKHKNWKFNCIQSYRKISIK